MDKSLTKQTGACVALANWFQFGSGERVAHELVQSRMLLWGVLGGGRVTVNGEVQELRADDWMLLPWDHAIEYEASAEEPFLVGGINLVVWAGATAMPFAVSHSARAEVARSDLRSDPMPEMSAVQRGRFDGTDPLRTLATHIVEAYAEWRDEARLSALALLLIGDLRRRCAALRSSEPAVPGALQRMQEFVRNHLGRALTVEEIAGAGGVSLATANRMFQRHTGVPASRWMAERRMEEAARLLRTTSLRVKDVGAKVGFADPFHFSRFFRRHWRVAPSEYQRRHQRL